MMGAELRHANLDHAEFRRAKLVGATLDEGQLNINDHFGAALPAARDITAVTSLRMLSYQAFALSPDGDLLACADAYTGLTLWEVETGQEIRRLEGHGGSVRSVAYSPDGHHVVSGSNDGTVRLWEVETGQEIRRLEGHGSSVQSVAYSPDGHHVVSGSDDGAIRLWHTSGILLATLYATTTGWATFAPDGRYKFSGDILDSFWFLVGLCRFEPGELDPYLPEGTLRRLPLEASIIS